MSAENISFGFAKGPTLKLNDFLLQTSNTPVFPILLLHFTPDTKHSTYEIEVTVGSKHYELIKGAYGTDNLALFESVVDGGIGLWSFDMLIGLQILSSLKIISELKEWIIKARSSMASLLSKEKIKSEAKNPQALKACEEILSAYGLLPEVQGNTLLSQIVKDLVAIKRMDADTIIYRVAMSIFHSKIATNEAVIEKIEDPSTLYLNLSQSNFYKSNTDAFSPMSDLDIRARNIITKVVAVFSVAAYIYYKQ